jgi:thymidylate kinase
VSGLDGSGKSTQAEGLARSLQALGYPTVVTWTSLLSSPALNVLAAPARLLVRLRSGSNDPGPTAEPEPRDERASPASALRTRSATLTLGWTLVVTLLNAWSHNRATRAHLARGRVVICDRYLLDSFVQLRDRYGSDRRWRLHRLLLRVLSPRPLRAYFLDLDPDLAYGRRADYSLDRTRRRAGFYRAEHAALGVRRLDATRPPAELCAEIADDVWAALTER